MLNKPALPLPVLGLCCWALCLACPADTKAWEPFRDQREGGLCRDGSPGPSALQLPKGRLCSPPSGRASRKKCVWSW